ncbi:MAG: hypothetical protein E7513_04675 [Ruminococcaceae bacterium]|nr:hypothetical protein [Oscillospiraceae bacterium]
MKKLLVVLLAITLVMMSVVPAFAAENDVVATQSSPDQVTPDSRVQQLYNAFVELKNTLYGNDLTAFLNAYDDFEAISTSIDTLTDEEAEELVALFGSDMEGMVEELLTVAIVAGFVKGVYLDCEEFKATPNTSTAVMVIEDLESIAFNEEIEDDEFSKAIRNLISDIDEVYKEALEYKPTDRVYKLYESYYDMLDLLEWYLYEDLEETTKEFRDAYNSIDEFTDEEKDQISALIGLPFEEAIGLMVSDYIEACIIVDTGKIYDAYIDNPCKDTAQALVDQYDGIFNDPSFSDEYLEDLIGEYFYDLEELYLEAKAMLEKDDDDSDDEDDTVSGGDKEDKKPQKGADSTKTEESTKVNTAAVKTGDTTIAVIYFAFSLIVLAVFCFIKKRTNN